MAEADKSPPTQNIRPFVVHDPRFVALVNGHALLDKLATGCRWAEGPAYFPAGRYLVWSDIPNDCVLRWDDTDGSVSVFMQPAMNSNGHTVDAQGRLVSCEHRGRCVSRVEVDGTRTLVRRQMLAAVGEQLRSKFVARVFPRHRLDHRPLAPHLERRRRRRRRQRLLPGAGLVPPPDHRFDSTPTRP